MNNFYNNNSILTKESIKEIFKKSRPSEYEFDDVEEDDELDDEYDDYT